MKLTSATVVGSMLAAFGVALALWVLFNLFVELQPESRRMSPAPAMFFSSALIAVGVSRATGGGWRRWALWRSRVTYVAAAAGLSAVVLAYVYNTLLRLQDGLRRPVDYVSLVADVVLLLMCARVFKWLAAGWRSAAAPTRET